MSSGIASPADPGPRTDLESMPSFLLSHIVHEYQRGLQSRLKAAGCSPLKMRIVLSLRSYGRMTVGDLCNFAIAEQPTMSRALDSLEGQGLVRREHSKTDSRLRLVSLTESGIGLCERIYPEFIRLNAMMTDGMAETDRADFIGRLRGVLNNLRRI